MTRMLIFVSLLMASPTWAHDSKTQRDERASSHLPPLTLFTAPAQSTSTADAKSPECIGASAARLALAALYQGCKAAETSKGGATGQDACQNQTETGNIKSTFGQDKSGGGQCGMGGQPQYSQAGARIQVTNNVCYPGAKTDCSAFVCGTLARAGQNVSPGKPCTNATTEEMVNWGPPCFEKVTDGQIKDGDIIVGRAGSSGHTGRVCGQSGSSVEASSNLSAFQFCHAASQNSGILMQPLDQVAANSKIGGAIKGGGGVILRHVGDKVSGCTSPPKPFQGEDCVKNCPNINPAIQSSNGGLGG